MNKMFYKNVSCNFLIGEIYEVKITNYLTAAAGTERGHSGDGNGDAGRDKSFFVGG